MKELIKSDSFQDINPAIAAGLQKAQAVFNSIKSFEDIEAVFLKGAGLAKNTYRSYLTAVKQLYEFTGHKNPLQIMPADIECFFDDLIKKVDRDTASLRIAGLKKFFKGVRRVIPIYTSPFDLMNEKLTKKLNKSKKGNRARPALLKKEANDLLNWLSRQVTLQGVENYAIVFMLITSGLRVSELCQLKWKNIEILDGSSIKAFFTGKGSIEAEQELYEPAVEACREYFLKAFNRDPGPEDNLFYTLRLPGHPIRPLSCHCLWERVKRIGKGAKQEGVIKRDINITPHTFRRSYATLLSKLGMRLKSIQVKTRHSNIETLTKHYIDDSEPAGKYLDKLFKNGKKGSDLR